MFLLRKMGMILTLYSCSENSIKKIHVNPRKYCLTHRKHSINMKYYYFSPSPQTSVLIRKHYPEKSCDRLILDKDMTSENTKSSRKAFEPWRDRLRRCQERRNGEHFCAAKVLCCLKSFTNVFTFTYSQDLRIHLPATSSLTSHSLKSSN